MNENLFATKDYENISDWTLGENKPNQTQFHLPPKTSGFAAGRNRAGYVDRLLVPKTLRVLAYPLPPHRGGFSICWLALLSASVL